MSLEDDYFNFNDIWSLGYGDPVVQEYPDIVEMWDHLPREETKPKFLWKSLSRDRVRRRSHMIASRLTKNALHERKPMPPPIIGEPSTSDAAKSANCQKGTANEPIDVDSIMSDDEFEGTACVKMDPEMACNAGDIKEEKFIKMDPDAIGRVPENPWGHVNGVSGSGNAKEKKEVVTNPRELMDSEEPSEGNAEKPASTVEAVTTFTCSKCPETFGTEGKRDYHVKTFHQGIKNVCEVCGQRFAFKTTLHSHRLTKHSGNEHKCDECGKVFEMPYTLYRHKAKVHKNVKYPCPDCDRCFATSSSRNLHYESVHLGLIYPCDTCGKEFSRKDDLRKHQRRMHSAKAKVKKVVTPIDNV